MIERTASIPKRAASLALLAASCVATGDDGQRIDVTQANELGVVAVTTDRAQVSGNDVFTLHALGASGQDVAFVRLTVGVIPDLHTLAPGDDDRGAEFIVSVGGNDLRTVTREMHVFPLDSVMGRAAEIRQFLTIDAVSTALRQVNMIVPQRTAEKTYWTTTCGSSQLNTLPTALQCCQNGASTMFARPSDQAIIYRNYNYSYGLACKASDGISSCSGSSCYFGPNKFSAPQISGPFGNVAQIFDNNGDYTGNCSGTWDAADNFTHEFGDVTGSFATGQGCPGGATGAGQWDY